MTSQLRVIPLGGLGEIGKNMMAFEYEDDIVVVDCGVQFPEEGMFGIDLIIPDVSYLVERADKVRAILITHGHEDHIGALPFILPQLNVPVYAPRLAHGLISAKLKERRGARDSVILPIDPGEVHHFGTSFDVSWFRVCHSIPDAMGIAIGTPLGTVIHTGDFKIDHTPADGKSTDFSVLSRLASEGVLLLMSDSTYAEVEGYTESEQVVGEALERAIGQAAGRVMVATFASLISRVQQVTTAAVAHGRKVAVVGRSMMNNVTMAKSMGYLDAPEGTLVSLGEARKLPLEETVIIATGSQGEPTAALSRITTGEHRHLALEPGDAVVFSARAIPGNEKAIGRVMDHIARRGAECVHGDRRSIHVSGHASKDELTLMLSLIRPRYFVPIHGEYRFLAEHARVATESTDDRTEVLLLENGQVVRFSPGTGGIVDSVKTGRTLLDRTRAGEVVETVLRERQHLGREGVVVPVVTVSRQGAGVVGTPEVITRGMVLDEQVDMLLETLPELVREIVAEEHHDESPKQGQVAEQVRGELQRVFRRRLGRRPVVLPVIMES